MAANFQIQTQNRTVQVLSPNQVADVMEVGATTIPHGVYFEVIVPLTVWGTSGQTAFIDPLATAIEQYLTGGVADSAYWWQDVDASGLLTDYIRFMVSITPPAGATGPMEAAVDVPTALLISGIGGQASLVGTIFSDAIANLTETANL